MRSNPGFTLVELMIAIAIVVILSTLAVPSFARLQRDNARTAAVNEFFHSLFLARSEAVKRGLVVSVCRSRNGRRCANTAGARWEDGYVVFVNRDRDEPAQIDSGEEVLHVVGPWKGGRITSNRPTYSFRPYSQGVVNGTIVFCDDRGPDHARAIIISHTGRPRISRRDASNRRLSCSS
jgi:type IV fimbrial biogenesis protein FimT